MTTKIMLNPLKACNVMKIVFPTWRGVQGTQFIYHGEWADPEIYCDDQLFNATQLEDYAWSVYNDDCKEFKVTPNEDDYDKLPPSWFEDRLNEFLYS